MVLEELLIVILQFIGELVVDIVIWLPWDILTWRSEEYGRRTPSAWAMFVVGSLLGAAIGAVSLSVLRTTFLQHEASRLANLVVAPFVCALLARKLARLRLERGRKTDPRMHFWFALAFSAAFLLMRFAWAGRP